MNVLDCASLLRFIGRCYVRRCMLKCLWHKANPMTNLDDPPVNSLLSFETDFINTLSEFSEVTLNMLLEIIMILPNKSSMNDRMPLPFVKKFIDILLSILFYIITYCSFFILID